MFRYLSENITFVLLKKRMLNKEKRDVYEYGIEVILLNSVLLISILLISIIGKSLTFFGGFLLFFLPIRVFVGGYHAKHSETCLILSVAMYVVSMIIYIKFAYLYKNDLALILFFVSVIILTLWSHLKNPKHQLTKYQYRRNKYIVCCILTLQIVLFIIFYKMNYTIASCEIILIILASGLLVIGKIGKKVELYWFTVNKMK